MDDELEIEPPESVNQQMAQVLAACAMMCLVVMFAEGRSQLLVLGGERRPGRAAARSALSGRSPGLE